MDDQDDGVRDRGALRQQNDEDLRKKASQMAGLFANLSGKSSGAGGVEEEDDDDVNDGAA